MDVASIPEIFQSKVRLAIITALISGEKTFMLLKKITGTTDGNLSSHLLKLEEKGYIYIKKQFIEKKPNTSYMLTQKGRKEFTSYVDCLYNELHNKI